MKIYRLDECEKLMIAMQMSGWLNDHSLCMQSIVHIYDLLTPVIYWQFPVQPAVEVTCCPQYQIISITGREFIDIMSYRYYRKPLTAQFRFQVLSHVIAGLQEVQNTYKNRRQNSTTEGIQHMVSSLTYYIAKVGWN